MRKIIYSIIVLSIFGFRYNSATETGQILILKYSDFGPPSMSYELLGQEWWQWQTHGHSKPGRQYAVKVVVYRNISLREVKKAYAVNIEKKQDYRYLEYDRALVYLEQQISYLEDWKKRNSDSYLPDLMTSLKKTKETILSHLTGQ